MFGLQCGLFECFTCFLASSQIFFPSFKHSKELRSQCFVIRWWIYSDFSSRIRAHGVFKIWFWLVWTRDGVKSLLLAVSPFLSHVFVSGTFLVNFWRLRGLKAFPTLFFWCTTRSWFLVVITMSLEILPKLSIVVYNTLSWANVNIQNVNITTYLSSITVTRVLGARQSQKATKNI